MDDPWVSDKEGKATGEMMHAENAKQYWMVGIQLGTHGLPASACVFHTTSGAPNFAVPHKAWTAKWSSLSLSSSQQGHHPIQLPSKKNS
jgi:hypothetical protein